MLKKIETMKIVMVTIVRRPANFYPHINVYEQIHPPHLVWFNSKTHFPNKHGETLKDIRDRKHVF
jgi:hypothetical protein